MAMKRQHPESHGAGEGELSTKKRNVSQATFVKWRAEMDKECQTMSWLDCEVVNKGLKKVVRKLKCKVCLSKIAGRLNYSDKWVVGADFRVIVLILCITVL